MRTRAVLLLALSLVAFVNLGRSQVTEPAATPPPAAAPAETPAVQPPATVPPAETPAPAAVEPTAVAPAAVVAPDATATAPAAIVPADAAAVGTAKPVGDGRLSVDFPDEEIRNILRNVADLFELNLIIPETLQGKATIKLRNVTWRQIFQKVLTPIGYGFIEDDNVVSVVTLD